MRKTVLSLVIVGTVGLAHTRRLALRKMLLDATIEEPMRLTQQLNTAVPMLAPILRSFSRTLAGEQRATALNEATRH